ncbi:hypothetical protein [Streptomyces sp. NPDC093514]|uniref:hypothetical protein n=1 Tax=Streptomyces sp. NPDC093514 TaxID=3366039 RepID=UPI00380DC9A2
MTRWPTTEAVTLGRRHPGFDPPQRSADRFRVGGLHHRTRPTARPDVRGRDQTRTRRPPPRRDRHPQPQPARRLPLVEHLTHQ